MTTPELLGPTLPPPPSEDHALPPAPTTPQLSSFTQPPPLSEDHVFSPASTISDNPLPPPQLFADPNTSLRNRLRMHSIAPEASRLLLGDSVIRGINMRRSVPAEETFQTLCVPGVKVADLIAWLRDQPPTTVHDRCHLPCRHQRL